MQTWARSVIAGTVASMPKVYADDAGVLSKASFARASQQKLNVEKTRLGIPQKQRCKRANCFVLNGEHLDVVK